MNSKYTYYMKNMKKYGIEFVVFMIILTVVDMKRGATVSWIMNIVFSLLIIVAQMTLDKRRDRYEQ